MTKPIPTTAHELCAACSLPLCYAADEIQPLLDRVPTEGLESVLLSIEPHDAQYLLAGLLPQPARVEWAGASAARARAYADGAQGAADAADWASYAATYATRAADGVAAAATAGPARPGIAHIATAGGATAAATYAAHAAAAATYAADAADARAAEHRIAIQHAIALLGWS